MRMVLRADRVARSVRRRDGGGWAVRLERERVGERKMERAVVRSPVP